MNAAIILFPGTNREGDMAAALRLATGREPQIVWHGGTTLPDGTDVVVLPGGFAHGDYLRAGAMAARSPVMRAVADHAGRGGRVLGVCNGFQTLCEAGLLPGVLLRNRTLRFVCRDVMLRIEAASAFTTKDAVGRTMRVPVAHHDGNYFADAGTLDRLEGEGRVVFRYVDGSNPNGATRDIAGIANEGRNVVGLMPHPEDRVEPAHGGLDGRLVFEALAA